MPTTPANKEQIAFQRLWEIVNELREKCPWDKVQTKETLRHLTIEEVYELGEAILDNNYDDIKEELGDVLLHILFYGSLAQENGHFKLAEMIHSQCEKLIRRHPHIYGDMQGATTEEINANWERIKAAEKAKKGKTQKLTLDGVPSHLPSIIKAYRMQGKAAKMGFDWDHADQVWDKIKEEILEFEQAENEDQKEDEMGDLLFALINYCRKAGINPEQALSRTNQKFKQRFDYVERTALHAGRSLPEMELQEMELLWQEAKGRLQ